MGLNLRPNFPNYFVALTGKRENCRIWQIIVRNGIMSRREKEKFSAAPRDIKDITEVLEQLPPEGVQTLQEIFSIISQPGGSHKENQRKLEQIAKGLILANAPAVYLLLPLIEKMRDMSFLKNLTYADNLEFFAEVFDPRGIMDPRKGKPLSGQRILSASRKLGRKMRGK